jgi:hypothetical protein
VKHKKAWLFVSIFLFVCGTIALTGQEKKTLQRQLPSILKQDCPDIVVTAVDAKLIGTQVGDSSADFPHDTVRVEATLKNGGNKPVPAGTILHIEFKRNGQTFTFVDPVGVLSDPGSSWSIARTDKFPHNAQTTYTVAVTTSLNECQKANNQATLTIDEARLHPSGTPDLTCSIFKVEKRWQQQGSSFKGSCYFAAEVSNIGKGSAQTNSQPLQLMFYQNKDRLLTKVLIPESEIPAPGYNKVFSTEVPDTDVPYGEYAVYATIEQVRNETNRNNNWSANAGRLNNSAEAPVQAMAKISFPSWGMLGQILNIHIEATNLQYQNWSNLRLILYKNDAVLKQWKGLVLGPGAKVRQNTTDDRPSQESVSGRDVYKAILTTDNSSSITPPAGTILDMQTRPFTWMDMAENLLQQTLQDPVSGIGAKMKASDDSLSISDEKTKVSITPESIFVEAKGNKRLRGGPRLTLPPRYGSRPTCEMARLLRM